MSIVGWAFTGGDPSYGDVKPQSKCIPLKPTETKQFIVRDISLADLAQLLSVWSCKKIEVTPSVPTTLFTIEEKKSIPIQTALKIFFDAVEKKGFQVIPVDNGYRIED